MWLVNFPILRVTKDQEQSVLEMQTENWLGKKKWNFVLSISPDTTSQLDITTLSESYIFPKVRIHKDERGWVVQIHKKTWYGKEYWTHIISAHGFSDEPWHFSSYESALDRVKTYFIWDLMLNTRDN